MTMHPEADALPYQRLPSDPAVRLLAGEPTATAPRRSDMWLDETREPDETAPQPDLVFRTLAEVAADVDSRPPRPWLFEPVIVAGDYGVMSAEDKAGKTWAILDAAVSCSAGLPWLGQFPASHPGPVLVFLGEGSDAKLLRRIRAVAASKGLDRATADVLEIVACFRAPQLSDAQHRHYIRQALAKYRPVLVIIDPLYLAAGGANGADLYSMGALLGGIQHIAQEAGASLLISHHWNKTGEGKGHHRSSGVGPGAWGRFLVSVAVLSGRTEPDTQETTVRLKWMFKGDEIPETDIVLARRVRAEDPTDLNSPMHYAIELAQGDGSDDGEDNPRLRGLRPSAKRVLAVLEEFAREQGPLATSDVRQIGDVLAKQIDGPLKARTIQQALKDLRTAELAIEAGECQGASLWRASLGVPDVP